MAIFTRRDGKLQLRDGAGRTFVVRFTRGTLQVAASPLRRPDEQLVLDRQRAGSLSHYLLGSDRAILEPGDVVGFAALLDSVTNLQDLRAALTVGTVAGVAWSSTKGTTSQQSGTGAIVELPGFADAQKKTVDVVWELGGSYGVEAPEVYWLPERITVEETGEGLLLAAAGLVYGGPFLGGLDDVIDLIPFRTSTDLADGAPATIEVDDLAARLSRSTMNDEFPPGTLSGAWTTANPNGGYILKRSTGQVWMKSKRDNNRILDPDFTACYLYKLVSGDFDLVAEISMEDANKDFEGCGFVCSIDNDLTVMNWYESRLFSGSGSYRVDSNNTVNSATTDTVDIIIGQSNVFFRFTRVGNVFTLYYKLTAGAGWTQIDTKTRTDLGSAPRVGFVIFDYVTNPDHIVKILSLTGSHPDTFSDAALPGWSYRNPASADVWNGTGDQVWIAQHDGLDNMFKGTSSGGISSPRIQQLISGTEWTASCRVTIANSSNVDNEYFTLGVFDHNDPATASDIVNIVWKYKAVSALRELYLSWDEGEGSGKNYGKVSIAEATTTLSLRFDRSGSDFLVYYRVLDTSAWTFLGATKHTPIPNPCTVFCALSNSGVAKAFALAKVEYFRGGIYPTANKVAKAKLVTPSTGVTKIKSVQVVANLNGGTGSGRVFYGTRGGGSPSTATSSVVLADGITELLTAELLGDYEYQAEITLASATGTERPAVDTIVGVRR